MPFPCYFGRQNQNQKQKQRRWRWRRKRERMGEMGRDNKFRIKNRELRFGKKDQSELSLWFDVRVNVIHVRMPCCCHWRPIVLQENPFLGLHNYLILLFFAITIEIRYFWKMSILFLFFIPTISNQDLIYRCWQKRVVLNVDWNSFSPKRKMIGIVNVHGYFLNIKKKRKKPSN